MSTTSTRKGRDRWLQISASWSTYQRLLLDRGARNRPKYIYLNRRLTIVSPGAAHEKLKKRVGGLIEEICTTLLVPFLAFGETTYLKTEVPRSGSEPDESYYLTHLDEMGDKDRVVMGVDPAPDLVVEVVFSHPAGDAIEAYRRFGVREIWVCKREKLVFLVLGPDGRYAPAPASAVLPFLDPDELTPWAYRHDLPNDAELRSRFRSWVRETLAPRLGQSGA